MTKAEFIAQFVLLRAEKLKYTTLIEQAADAAAKIWDEKIAPFLTAEDKK